MSQWATRLSLRHLAGPELQPVLITRRRIYIMPNGFGLLLSLVLAVMLFGAINYNNSIGFAVTFLLASVAILSLVHANNNLAQLKIRAVAGPPVFCGEYARFQILLTAGSGSDRYSIEAINDHSSAKTDIPANDTGRLWLKMPTRKRGYVPLGRFRLLTEYPFGIARAWSWLYPQAACLVYPAPEKQAPLPKWMGDGDAGQPQEDAIDDFHGFRDYHPGDSPKRISWKQFPADGTLLTKLFCSGHAQDRWLNWDAVSQLPLEQALSRLTRWVLECERAGIRYGLSLPNKKIGCSLGQRHQHECLKALALYRLEEY